MSRINEKLGLRRAGKRAVMKDAGKTAAAAAITSKQCPKCGHRWILHNVAKQRTLCAWCGRFDPPITPDSLQVAAV